MKSGHVGNFLGTERVRNGGREDGGKEELRASSLLDCEYHECRD